MALGWLATRSNGTNSRPMASAGMPSPVSVTLMRSRPPGTGSQPRRTLPPSRLYLTALDSRFSRTCLSRWQSPRTWVVQDTLGPAQHDVVLVGQRPDQADGLGGHVGQGDRLQRQPPNRSAPRIAGIWPRRPLPPRPDFGWR
jgi:hypothetical protein